VSSILRRSKAFIRSFERGVTLVEILVVLVLIAMLVSGAVIGTGGVASSRLRGATSTVVALTRVAITRTNATGRPVRLVCDLDKNQMWLEEAQSSRALRVDLSTESSREKARKRVEDERLKDVKAKADADAERMAEGTTIAKASFVPVKGLEIAGEKVGGPLELGGSIEFRQIHIEHDGEPRTKGKAYLYFWPGGETEWASIQIRRSGEKEGLTVLVSPLTGRARIERGNVELPKASHEGDIDESEGET
jgi:general secretion pathway protein H